MSSSDRWSPLIAVKRRRARGSWGAHAALWTARSVAIGALVSVGALSLAQPAAGSSRYKACALSLRDQLPPGGTQAYNLTVERARAGCRTVVAVMESFHRCRTSARTGCPRTLAGGWRCSAGKTAFGSLIYGRFTCAAKHGRRVRGTYQQDTPGCFGAAAHDPALRCFSQARSVFPAFGQEDPEVLCPCEFGVPPAQATRTVALIGDSHTLHWRAALDVVAHAELWHGLLATTGGCFFSAAVGSFNEGCVPWYEGTLGWVREHPEIDTVFVTSNADTPVTALDGMTADEVKIDGFRRAWEALPKTVEHLVVLRDLTKSTPETFDCVYAADSAGTQRLASLCPLPRAQAQQEDLGVETVRRLRDERYSAIDMTRYVCGRLNCYPVVGGVRVNGDQWGHLQPTFMRTLGPYLLREVRRLEASWSAPARRPARARVQPYSLSPQGGAP